MSRKTKTQSGMLIYLAIPERMENDGDYERAARAWTSASGFAKSSGDERSSRVCLANAKRCSDMLSAAKR